MVRACIERYNELSGALDDYQQAHGELLGLRSNAAKDTLVQQMIASLRRTEYIRFLDHKVHSPRRSDPHDAMFDPLIAAHMLRNEGHLDEAVWHVFLATQFGKHAVDGWKLCANIFGSFGQGPIWTKEEYAKRPLEFETMLNENSQYLQVAERAGRYSNHRQYVSRKPDNISKTFREAYVWLFQYGSFADHVRDVHRRQGQEPAGAFDELYHSMRTVHSYGRLGAFDFLTMIGKLELAPILPGSTYLVGATGPLRGARLLFHGATDFPIKERELQIHFDRLDDFLNIGKQPLEDSVCNWQKNPEKFVHFRG
ncbi:hypothetical protein [uncultured Paracoccus sp.]|uniref:alpha-glutamyl/putrescinyl thymine pyrophosphorylase clade 3 protein n=1 Tax=uncultured Paracoccus sp. TaxID=189685 RepID=UPI002625C6E5|nr:hypothetical protein [uncultured Paracoccus sp.]